MINKDVYIKVYQYLSLSILMKVSIIQWFCSIQDM